MEVPDDLKYSKEHEWIRVDGDIGVIGISDYAQGELGDVVYVELPEIGKELKSGDPFGTIEAVKAVSELFCPVSGEVTEVNEKLEGDPALINQTPYGDGWMIKLKLANPDELSGLMDAAGYKDMIGA
ncbi:MAG: glycine cleavage system protein GcvH [candidate division Zixibacteria bacterium]|jgi:glycine cleavage system H protein|nr:glycine cleavage system protein GcvH [candidate division Zixibacteria bacterium]